MNDNDNVMALKCCSRTDAHSSGCDSCPYEYCGTDCNNLCKVAADLIESLQAQLAASQARERAAKEGCETCVNRDTDSYRYYTYPCNECKHRARDSYTRGTQDGERQK